MLALLAKALLAGGIVALISVAAQRQPAIGALAASLPLVSILGMLFLWSAKPDAANMAIHMEATFWYVIPSLPMFLVMPWLLRHQIAFAPTLMIGCAMTIALYLLLSWIAPRFGLPI
jgi:uncharacterized membrane protein (GlpM family)